MSYYPREEQETHYHFDPINGNWRVYSTYPPHIRKILANGLVAQQHRDADGRVIAVDGLADANQMRLYKPRL